MFFAKKKADEFGARHVCTEHVLLALLDNWALIDRALDGIAVEELRNEIAAHLPRSEPLPFPHDLPVTSECRRALLLAVDEADRLGHSRVRDEHVLLGLFGIEDSYTALVLRKRGVSDDKIRALLSALDTDDQTPRG